MPLRSRLLSIDACRGLAIVLMILVNFVGLTPHAPWLHHAPWDGCTLADTVFPLFLFVVGFSTGLARKSTANILIRAGYIFVWGLILNFIMHPSVSHLRIPGVLQRIAICYALTACLHLKTTFKTQYILVIILLLGYWMMLRFIPVPHHGMYVLTPDGNLSGFIDRMLLSGHTYPKTHDAEGILSTLPALASTLIGLLSYQLFMRFTCPKKRFFALLSFGLLCFMLGWLTGQSLPINKNLWTSSFALWTSGISLFIFSACYLVTDVWCIRVTPFLWLGRHALVLYLAHVLLIKAFLILR